MSRSSNVSKDKEGRRETRSGRDTAVERVGEAPHLQRSGLTMLKREREKKSRASIFSPFLERESITCPLVSGASVGRIPNIWIFL